MAKKLTDIFDFRVILVDPARPENIGFCARAMKTMGFSSLHIVKEPYDLFDTMARKTAYGSHDVLELVNFHPNLKLALENTDFSIGTTSKKRTLRKEMIECADLPAFLTKKQGSVTTVALVFGNEEAGLSKEDINLCDVVSTIPMQVEYPSLNLSQSVLVYLYELTRPDHPLPRKRKEEPGLFKSLTEESDKLLRELGVDENPSYMRRIQDRIRHMGTLDAHMAMTVIKKLKNRLF